MRQGLVVAYNVAFVMPLVAVIVVRMAAGDAPVHRLHHFGTWLVHHAERSWRRGWAPAVWR